MKLWLDDIRDPNLCGFIGWTWAKTADEAINALKTGKVEEISLDHDLSVDATLGNWMNEVTGYDVVKWMCENKVFPDVIMIHTMNPAGRKRMEDALRDFNIRTYYHLPRCRE